MITLLTAYLITFMTVLQITLGILGWTFIGTLTGGDWFETLEPSLRRYLKLFPVLALAFVPLLWFLPHVHGEREGFFLNPIAFDLRAIIYWALWIFWTRAFRPTDNRVWAGLGLLMLLFTTTFAAIDWIMMLDREWVSSGFGLIFIVDSLLASLAFILIVKLTRSPEAQPIGDLANLLLMAVLLWIYMHFMEYLIIWQGQIPREIRWYDIRFASPYLIPVWATLLFSFIIPFPILLFKKLKRNPVLLLCLAWGALTARLIETHVLISPTQNVSPLPVLLIAAAWGAAWVYFNLQKERDDG